VICEINVPDTHTTDTAVQAREPCSEDRAERLTVSRRWLLLWVRYV